MIGPRLWVPAVAFVRFQRFPTSRRRLFFARAPERVLTAIWKSEFGSRARSRSFFENKFDRVFGFLVSPLSHIEECFAEVGRILSLVEQRACESL